MSGWKERCRLLLLGRGAVYEVLVNESWVILVGDEEDSLFLLILDRSGIDLGRC